MTADEKHMVAALTEARKGLGQTHPNPAVGAVIVRGNRTLAKGWHQVAGGPHAEVAAMENLSDGSPRGATLYVTLEPCSTTGRTPPCTDAIIRAGIRRVVFGATDPNPRHAGRAVRVLRKAGLQVTTGVLALECEALNASWNQWIATGLPYVIAKAGMTLDGRISSPPDSRWITSAASRRDAMALRASVHAILIGGETLRIDNPRLTVRGRKGSPQPLRAVWTKSGLLPPDAHLFCDPHRNRTLILPQMSLRAALRALGHRGAARVLIEGGGTILGEAFDRGLVNEVCFYLAPILCGGPTPTVGARGVSSNAQSIQLGGVTHTRIGQDVKLTAQVLKAGKK
jgi:diaminohydroxyphosphoribosylaminopyrimidine deaminase / 5-amino-6-(5-phosphoribosylamino)uracil reductase